MPQGVCLCVRPQYHIHGLCPASQRWPGHNGDTFTARRHLSICTNMVLRHKCKSFELFSPAPKLVNYKAFLAAFVDLFWGVFKVITNILEGSIIIESSHQPVCDNDH